MGTLSLYTEYPDIENLPNRKRQNFPDIDDEVFWSFYDRAKKYSMIHIPGFYNVYRSVEYIAAKGIQGSYVECGVWLGGASIMGLLALDHFGRGDCKAYLYDTCTGFPEGQTDFILGKVTAGFHTKNFRAELEANLRAEGFEPGRYVLVEGEVEKTLQSIRPERISLLRLDTDFYLSTKAEFEHLYPLLSDYGVLIVDDYGMFRGSRTATDEYLAGKPILLDRIDRAVRCGVKIP